jgi:hypothetical protein
MADHVPTTPTGFETFDVIAFGRGTRWFEAFMSGGPQPANRWTEP